MDDDARYWAALRDAAFAATNAAILHAGMCVVASGEVWQPTMWLFGIPAAMLWGVRYRRDRSGPGLVTAYFVVCGLSIIIVLFAVAAPLTPDFGSGHVMWALSLGVSIAAVLCLVRTVRLIAILVRSDRG